MKDNAQRRTAIPVLRVVAWSVLIASALVAVFLIYNRIESISDSR